MPIQLSPPIPIPNRVEPLDIAPAGSPPPLPVAHKVARRRGRVPLWLSLLSLPYAVALFLLSVFNMIGPETWWLTGILQYGPQAAIAAPGVLLLLLALVFARRALWLPLLLCAWAAGPLMGLRANFHRLIVSPAPADAPRLRIMTYNVKWAHRDPKSAAQEVVRANPDLLVMQDSQRVEDWALTRALSGYTLKRSGQYLVASRLPISELSHRDISFPGSNHHATRFSIFMGGREIVVFNVHLLSPRGGLNALRRRQKQGVRDNLEARLFEAERLAMFVREEHRRGVPVIVAGDLNAPSPTLVCRHFYRSNLHDAFSEAGVGYGYTYGRYTPLKTSYIRIDYILLSRELTTLRCWVGGESGSDHRPVIADVCLTNP